MMKKAFGLLLALTLLLGSVSFGEENQAESALVPETLPAGETVPTVENTEAAAESVQSEEQIEAAVLSAPEMQNDPEPIAPADSESASPVTAEPDPQPAETVSAEAAAETPAAPAAEPVIESAPANPVPESASDAAPAAEPVIQNAPANSVPGTASDAAPAAPAGNPQTSSAGSEETTAAPAGEAVPAASVQEGSSAAGAVPAGETADETASPISGETSGSDGNADAESDIGAPLDAGTLPADPEQAASSDAEEAAETDPAAAASDEVTPDEEPQADSLDSLKPGEIVSCDAADTGSDESASVEAEAVPEINEPSPVSDPEDVASAEAILPAAEYAEPAPADTLSSSAELPADVLPASSYPTTGTEGFVYRMYKIVLGREPEPQGFQFWVDSLNSGKMTAAQAVSGFFHSPEYQGRNKTNNEIVNDFYQVVLDRAPEKSGHDFWQKFLDVGMTTDVIVYGFMRSPEFNALASKYGITAGEIALTDPLDYNYDRTAFVHRLYKNCLGRLPDKNGQRYWCNLLSQGLTGSQIAQSFVFSTEYHNSRKDNFDFVEMLYNTMMGRASDNQGYNFWLKKLNFTDSRERVVNQFIFSPEFRDQCARANIEIGVPFAVPDETEEWRNNVEVLRLCNNARTAAGLHSLYLNEDLLWDLAMARAEEITEQFAHTRPNGTPWSTLFNKQGFVGYVGENLAGGQDSAQTVFNAWMNSPGHRANILSPNYIYLATGYLYDPGASTYCAEGTYTGKYVAFKHYWAQSFCTVGVPIN